MNTTSRIFTRAPSAEDWAHVTEIDGYIIERMNLFAQKKIETS